jgi:PKHD-type hydroxylase
MYVHIQNLLTPEQIETLDAGLGEATFADGAATAGPPARAVKQNLQLDKKKTSNAKELDKIILTALAENQMVRGMALPARILPPTYSKHEPGMTYGTHADNPIMPGNPPVRTDISITVFLSDPDSYEGGELAVNTEIGEAKFKLPKGDGLMYPSGALHTVREVTAGERLVAVTWVQSSVRDAVRRQLLFDLDVACQLVNRADPTTNEARLLLKTYGNLLRMWAEV